MLTTAIEILKNRNTVDGWRASVNCSIVGATDGKGPLDFEIFSHKRLFFSFGWEKTNFTTFGLPWKNVGKIPPLSLPGKNHSDARGWHGDQLLA